MISVYVDKEGKLVYDSSGQRSEITGLELDTGEVYWKMKLIW